MKRLLLTLSILFTLTVFASPNNMDFSIRKANIIVGDQQTGWKDVDMLATISDTRITIYSDETQIYDYVLINKKEFTDYTYYVLSVENRYYKLGTTYIRVYKNINKITMDIVYSDVTVKYILW